MVLLSATASSLPLTRPTQSPPLTSILVRPPRRFLFLPRYPPRLLSSSHFPPSPAPPLLSSPRTAEDTGFPLEELVERDWSFLDDDATNSDEQRAEKARRIIAAADIRETGSKVLSAFPTAGFVDRVVDSTTCELLAAIHESLMVLAMIKENHDEVRCLQGGLDVVPKRFMPLDAVFVCYFPGMGISIDQLFSSLAGMSSPGARVVLSFDQGREVIEQNHKQRFPDMVTHDLPDRITLEKSARENLFLITEFIDEPTFYLAVLRFQD